MVRPTLSDTVYDASPKLEPCKVTLVDPVAPLLARRATLSPPVSVL